MKNYTWLAVLAVGCFVVRGVGEETPAPAESTVYEVQAGDTLAGICERFLGGAEFMPELLGYNQIADAGGVVAGVVLAIPGQDRERAVALLAGAEAALVRAVDAAAETYAADEYALAAGTIADSRASRQRGEYSQASALARVGTLLADRSRQAADARAPIQQPAVLTAVHRAVEVSMDDGASWAQGNPGDELPVPSLVRTGGDGRAEITLADGSVVQVAQGSMVEVAQFRLDRRDGVRNSRLRVIMGSILGRVEPENMEASEFEIDTGEASVAIRGTELRVASADASTRLSVLAGATEMSAAGDRVDVQGGFGSYVKKGSPPSRPVRLLSPPGDLLPEEAIYQTAIQTPRFSWSPIDDRSFKDYHLELSQDVAFNAVIQDYRGDAAAYRADVLPEGSYFWRVSARDRKGIEGAFSRPRRVDVTKNYDVEVVPSEPPILVDGTRVAPPRVVYRAGPSHRNTSVVKTDYSLDGTTFQPAGEQIVLTEDGDYLIRVRGTCAEGETGPAATFEIQVDGTPPEVTVTLGDVSDDPGLGRMRAVSLAAADRNGVDVIEYRIGDGRYVEYGGPFAVSLIGDVRVTHRARDRVGNQSDEQEIVVSGDPVPRN